MAVLSPSDAQLAFRHVPLLDHAHFALETGERVGLIGPQWRRQVLAAQGAGGPGRLDDGLLQLQGGLRLVYVPQEPELRAEASIFEVVAEGVAEARSLRDR